MIVQMVRIETKQGQAEFEGGLKTMLLIKRELQKPARYLVLGFDGKEERISTNDITSVEYLYYDIRL